MEKSEKLSEIIGVPDNISEIMRENRENIIKTLIDTKCSIETGCRIPGTKEVECFITATSQQQIEECKKKFNEIFDVTQYSQTNEDTNDGENSRNQEAQTAETNNQITETHQVPAYRFGLVIGTKHRTINMISNKSGAKARKASNDRKIINIKGTPEQVYKCHQLIQAIVDGTMNYDDLLSVKFDFHERVVAGS